jgi:hypothetical protein
MTQEFIPYEQALELKELGFNEKCYGHYDSVGFLNTIEDYAKLGANILDMISKEFNSVSYMKEICFAPLYQQAFRWFREKYNLRGFIGFRPNIKQFDYHIYDMSLSGKEYVQQRTMEEFNKDPKVGTYEEAELACLKKLIEIVKNK